MKIGFVILTWNSEKVIGACLNSIFNMKEFNPYVVVVDNGSKDGTRMILSKAKPSANAKFEVIYNNINQGMSPARNAGLKRLQKYELDFYCILDSDTVVNEECFKLLSSEMLLHKKYGMIGPTMHTSSGLVQVSARSFPTALEKICKGLPIKSVQRIGEQMEVQHRDPSKNSYPVDYLMGACCLIRPEALAKAGYFDEKIFYGPDDAEYCIRIWKSGYQVAFCPKAEIIHEWQRLSKRRLFSKINWEHIKGLIYMFRKHCYFFSTKRLKNTFTVK